MRLSYRLAIQDEYEAEKKRAAYNEYQREQYARNKTRRQASLRQRREARVAWLNERLATAHCERCDFPTKAATRWHYRDIDYDHDDAERNLSQVRFLAQQGYSKVKIEQELARLIPLCTSCLAVLRPRFVPIPQPTARQQYIRQRNSDEERQQANREYQQHRRQVRLDWIAEETQKPCHQCGTDDDTVRWHKISYAADHREEAVNLQTLRLLANAGASFKRMAAELDTMIPLCPFCYDAWRKGHQELAKVSGTPAS